MRINLPATWLMLCTASAVQGATPVWSADLNFNEFLGQTGGFSTTPTTLASAGSGPVIQSFDLVKPVGIDPATGRVIYAEGQDGITDMTLRTSVISNNDGRWAATYSKIQPGFLRGNAVVNAGSSKPGDSAVNVVEISFNTALGITADQFSMRLSSTNGTSELYEWTMVTVGGVNDAPFNPAEIAQYGAGDYSNFFSGSFYNATGAPSGGAGTGSQLASGRSISQFLSNSPGAPVSGGVVANGWYAIDDYNVKVYDGPEHLVGNPVAGDGSIDDNQTITGLQLGGAESDAFSSVTIWFGYHDVAPDSDGDGYTSTSTNIYEMMNQIRIGASGPAPVPVPEPERALLFAISSAFLMKRRRK